MGVLKAPVRLLPGSDAVQVPAEIGVAADDIVLRVPTGSAAEQAGLRPLRQLEGGGLAVGDVIVSIDGKPVESVRQLGARLDDHQVGDVVPVDLQRGSARTTVRIALQPGS